MHRLDWGDISGEGSAYADVVGDALAQVVKSTCDEIFTIYPPQLTRSRDQLALVPRTSLFMGSR